MAYKELIKNFSKIRSYLKEFFVYGFNSRGNVGRKSDRSYDDEKRRIQSWLGDFVEEDHGPDGKATALSIDVRNVGFNPLYRAWKSASFTDKDITLHFILMDILLPLTESLSLSEIISRMDKEYLSNFSKPIEFDESTIRKKLAEYEKQGFIEISKDGNKSVYSLPKQALRAVFEPAEGIAANEVGAQGEVRYATEFCSQSSIMRKQNIASPSQIQNALDFASEILPAGIVGSTLLDKMNRHENTFAFKHHYITQSMDSEIMLTMFEAMRQKSSVQILTYNERRNKKEGSSGTRLKIIPLKILASSQTGRQYLIAHGQRHRKFYAFRLDNIIEAKICEPFADYDRVKKQFKEAEKYRWGTSFGNSGTLETVEFTVKFREDEEHIYKRLLREKRCGKVERLSPTEARYFAEVWDVHEMLPWIRTFIMRITELHISDKALEEQFWNDVRKMRDLYN